jgi:3-oxoacyl-[acyl-carrier protein] reductase
MDLQLKDKKALVFGSSAGIGRAIAESFIKEGATVLINGRNEERCRDTQEQIGAANFLIGDLSREGEAKRLTKEAISILGGLDVIVINTGGPEKGTFLDISIDQWKKDYQNLWLSFVEALHIAIPEMKKNHYGRVLFVTSIAAKEPIPNLTTSNGLRAGIEGLCKSMTHEFAQDGLTFNTILPGYTNTERLQALNLSEETVKELVPCGRLGEPQELGNLAAYLASPLAGYINGQSIAIDGGVLRSH